MLSRFGYETSGLTGTILISCTPFVHAVISPRYVHDFPVKTESFKDRHDSFTVFLQYQNCNLKYLRGNSGHSPIFGLI